MNAKFAVCLASLVVACALARPAPLSAAPQRPGGLNRQGLNNCDIDLRADDNMHEELQVFWKENAYEAVQYELWDRKSDALVMGDGDGNNATNGTDPNYVKAGGPNLVEFRHVKDEKISITITPYGQSKVGPVEVIAGGKYDPLGVVVPPEWQEVRGPSNLRRVRVRAENYGLIYDFTLTQAAN